MVKEHPIIFSTDMVKAILEGRKTQTRRVIKPQPELIFDTDRGRQPKYFLWKDERIFIEDMELYCPYGQVGDRLWVRENWEIEQIEYPMAEISYLADDFGGDTHDVCIATEKIPKNLYRVQPSIFMPRWASRITLEITGVRAERLQEISTKDKELMFEGIPLICYPNNRTDWTEMAYQFSLLWNSLNAKRGYPFNSNPFVWVKSFKRLGDDDKVPALSV